MAANHPCCNTKVVRNLRRWFKENSPGEWNEVYKNLKKIWESEESPYCWAAGDLGGAFVWSETPQGHWYWSSIDDRVRGF